MEIFKDDIINYMNAKGRNKDKERAAQRAWYRTEKGQEKQRKYNDKRRAKYHGL